MKGLVSNFVAKIRDDSRFVLLLHHQDDICPTDVPDSEAPARRPTGTGGLNVDARRSAPDLFAGRAAPLILAADEENVHAFTIASQVTPRCCRRVPRQSQPGT